jgi:NAD(P)H dehydrogenase (quinone)
MNVLTVYAHPNPKSLCHAILQEFTRGQIESGHAVTVVDLRSPRFDRVFELRDFASYVLESMPLDILRGMDLGKRIVGSTRGSVEKSGASL